MRPPVDGSAAGLVDSRYARGVAECLLTCGAFTVDLTMARERWFRWKSGITAPFGCDCRRVNAFPAARRLIDDALADAVRQAFPEAGYVVGVAQAGIPWAKTLAERLDLPLAYVRAQPRASGGPLVECAPREAGPAIMVDDVVASGETTRRAIDAISAETHLTVAGIQSIANWDFPEMRAALGQWPIRALTSYPHILDGALAAGLIDDAGFAQLGHFYADPRNHAWPD
jgi:orotate phosphoribosyltransferase